MMMKSIRDICCTLLFCAAAIQGDALKDSDMDGVPDSIDVCNHTPFYDTVNRYGCSVKRLVLPDEKDSHSLDLMISYGMLEDIYQKGDWQYLARVEMSYYQKSWIYTLKSSYFSNENQYEIDNTTIGVKKRYFISDTLRITSGIGARIPLNANTDITLSQSATYYLSETRLCFAGGSYTFVNDKNDKDEEPVQNQYTLFLGGGYFMTKNLYGSLSVSRIGSRLKTIGTYNSVTTTLFYQINSKWFTSLVYSYKILEENQNSSNIYLKLGYTFW